MQIYNYIFFFFSYLLHLNYASHLMPNLYLLYGIISTICIIKNKQMHTIEFPLWQMTCLIWCIFILYAQSSPSLHAIYFYSKSSFYILHIQRGYTVLVTLRIPYRHLEGEELKNLKYSQEIQAQANANIFNVSIFKMKINSSINFCFNKLFQ